MDRKTHMIMKLSKKIAILGILSLFISVTSGCDRDIPLDFQASDFQQQLKNTGFNISSTSGQIIIKRKKGINSFNSISPDFKTIKSIKNLNVEVVQVKNSGSMDNILKNLRNHPGVEYASPNFIRKIVLPKRRRSTMLAVTPINQGTPASTAGSDPMRKDQYALDITHAEQGWKITRGKANIIIAIVDTGIDPEHPDLKGKTVPGFSAIKESQTVKDENGHGTHVSGIASAITNNAVGISGMAPNCKIMPVKVLDHSGSGDDAGIIEGITWAADHGADIISMSLGGGGTSEAFEEAISYALKKNVVIIAAMGNDGQNIENYPAASKGVIAVGSTDAKDKISDFSNFGNWITVSAPGTQILSTFPTYKVDLNNEGLPQNYATLDGTSMAAPYVAGLAALIRSKYGKISPEQVKNIIIKGADDLGHPGFDDYFGHGRINVLKTISNNR